jgi:acyl-homoserine-lactone acylase
MKKLLPLILLFVLFLKPASDAQKPQNYVKNVTITRDQWGIPHIEGKTDADAVFGLMYAQCEDDFARIEMNYIEKLGRLSEVKGEEEIYNDLQIRILISESEAESSEMAKKSFGCIC